MTLKNFIFHFIFLHLTCFQKPHHFCLILDWPTEHWKMINTSFASVFFLCLSFFIYAVFDRLVDLHLLVSQHEKNLNYSNLQLFNNRLLENNLISKFASNSYIFSPIEYKSNLLAYQNQISETKQKRILLHFSRGLNQFNQLADLNNETVLLAA